MQVDTLAPKSTVSGTPESPRPQGVRLSSAQQQAWFLGQLVPDTVAYNFQAQLSVRGPLEVAILEAALAELVERHESLRTVFVDTDDGPRQYIRDAWRPEVPVIDLAGVPDEMRENYSRLLIDTELRKNIAVDSLPLIRWLLIREAPDRHLLLHIEHHLIHDGWSFRLFLRELATLYSRRIRPGSADPLPEASQFIDFCVEEGEWLSSDEGLTQRAFWRDRLTDWPVYNNSLRTAPVDERTALTFSGSSVSLPMPAEVLSVLVDLAHATRTTLFETMMAIFAAVVREARGLDRMIVGTAIANRDQPSTQVLVGMLVNMLPLRFSGSESLRTLLAQARDEVRQACANGRVPLSMMVEDLRPERRNSTLPFIQTAFNFHNSMSRDLAFEGLEVDILEGLSNGSAKFDLSVIVVFNDETDPRKGGRILVEYADDLAPESELVAFFEEYLAIARAWADAPDLTLKALRGAMNGPEDAPAYWRRQLEEPSDARLHGPCFRTALPSGRRKSVSLPLPSHPTEGPLAEADVLAAHALLLSRYTGSDDVLFGYQPEGRPDPLPLRQRIHESLTFAALGDQMAESLRAAQVHGDMPLGTILEVAEDGSLTNGQLPFQTVLCLRSTAGDSGDSGDSGDGAEVVVTVRRGASGDILEVSFDDGLFHPAVAERFARHFARLAAVSRDAALSTVDTVSQEEKSRLLAWSAGATPDYPERTVHGQFEDWVARQPEAVALRQGGRSILYGDLNRDADRLAAGLRAAGVAPGDTVGIASERSVDLITGLLGILKAGAAYVPVDPDSPEERQHLVLKETGARVVLSDAPAALAPNPAVTVLEIARLLVETPQPAAGSPGSAGTPDDRCYYMFTSGSTGTPKGVHSTHRGVVSLVVNNDYADIRPGDRLMHFAPLSFDASTFEIWGMLLNGATLVLQPGLAGLDELAETVTSEKITILWLTTSLFKEMMDSHGAVVASARHVMTGGDVVPMESVRKLFARESGSRFTVAYGPTECTTFATCHEIRPTDDLGDRVSIGRAIAHSNTYILDDHGRPVPPGVPGEIVVGGPGVSGAYLDRPALTAERYFPNPFIPGDTLFRTGDLGAWGEDGTIDFLGRKDDQVKIRGFRVEPGEVEAALRRLDGVLAGTVIVWKTKGEKCLVGFVVPVPGATLEEAALRTAVRELLPDYMVPARILVIDRLPLRKSGKIDKVRLAKLADETAPGAARQSGPASDMEIAVGKAWAEILGMEKIGPDEDFFSLGGHSLAAMRIMSQLSRQVGRRLPLSLLFDQPTVRALAAAIEEKAGGSAKIGEPA